MLRTTECHQVALFKMHEAYIEQKLSCFAQDVTYSAAYNQQMVIGFMDHPIYMCFPMVISFLDWLKMRDPMHQLVPCALFVLVSVSLMVTMCYCLVCCTLIMATLWFARTIDASHSYIDDILENLTTSLYPMYLGL